MTQKYLQSAQSKLDSVSKETLKMAGLDSVVVRQIASDFEVRSLLKNLCSEKSTHTWQNLIDIGRGDAFELLCNFENKKRPTDFFFYYGIKGSGEELVGVGTVAHRINQTFPHEGFPVIARCFIKQNYRNFRLYMPILQHRFEFCRIRFGDNLKGIHLGSQSPRIFSVVKKNLFGLPFIYVGDELLDQRSSKERVRDYLWLSSKSVESLNRLVSEIKNKTIGQDLALMIQSLIDNNFSSNSFSKIDSLFSDYLRRENPFLPNDHLFHQIMDLLNAIPVLKTDQSANDDLPIPASTRRKSA